MRAVVGYAIETTPRGPKKYHPSRNQPLRLSHLHCDNEIYVGEICLSD